MLNKRKFNEINYFESNGIKLIKVKEIKDETGNHFSRLYEKQKLNMPLECKCITDEDNERLNVEFNVEEINKAIWKCESSKSLGPDGINFGFIKEFWDVMKEDVIRFMKEFHLNGIKVR